LFLGQADFALLQNNIKILSNHEILHFGILVRSSKYQKSYLCLVKDSFFDFNQIAENGKIYLYCPWQPSKEPQAAANQ
jgi:hypothetical protein